MFKGSRFGRVEHPATMNENRTSEVLARTGNPRWPTRLG
jgi:hypothetical protein